MQAKVTWSDLPAVMLMLEAVRVAPTPPAANVKSCSPE